MLVTPIKNEPTFKSHKELLSKIDTDFYTGKYVEVKNRSTEHIIPRSKGGISNIINYAMTDKRLNSERGNLDLGEWIRIHPKFLKNIKEYISKYWSLKIEDIRYGQQIKKTLSSLNISV